MKRMLSRANEGSGFLRLPVKPRFLVASLLEMTEKQKMGVLFQTNVQVDLGVVGVLASLVIKFEVRFVGTSSAELFVIVQTVDPLPCLRDDLRNWSLRARHDRISVFWHVLGDHARRNVGYTAHFHPNDEIVVPVAVALVTGVNGVNGWIYFVRNLIRDAILKKLLPLRGDRSGASHFFGIVGSNLNSDDRELWQFHYSCFHCGFHVGQSCKTNQSEQTDEPTRVKTRQGGRRLSGPGHLISITSFSFPLLISSIFLISSSVSFWISSIARFSSSSVIFLSFIAFLMASLPSRRMLRTAVRCSSSILCRCLTISLRRSSVSGGTGTRIILPSFMGFNPMSAARIAFSIAGNEVGSNGCTVMSCGSGACTCAS